jgi:hypothetical protein
MKLIRIVKNWKNPDLLRQTPGNKGIWENIRFTLDPEEECDFLLVLNYIPEKMRVKCPPGNIWAMLQEPYLLKTFGWMEAPHDQFARVYTHHLPSAGPRYIKTQTCLPWHINRNYDELIEAPVPKKTKNLSWITTNKKNFPGHKLRMNFFEKLANDDIFNIDLFGFGFNPLEDKWDGLAPYKYSLAVENSSSEDYWTEKIADCFLSYTLPIYYGCTNLEKYFPAESFISIDINNYKESVDIIRRTLKENAWESRLDAIIEARKRVLEKYQLFPYITKQVKAMPLEETQKQWVTLEPYEKKK